MPSVAGSEYVGKAELAAQLGWTRDRLDRRIAADGEKFPVVHRASQGVAWKFDVDAVRAYVAKDDDAAPAKEMTHRSRRELAQARSIERKNKIEDAKLIDAEPHVDDLATTFIELNKALSGFPSAVAQRFGMPAETVPEMVEMLAEILKAAVLAVENALPDDAGERLRSAAEVREP